MKKALTKEEFLDKKNVEIHKEILGLFKIRTNNILLSNYIRKIRRENPNLLCGIERKNLNEFTPTYCHEQLLIDMVEALKNGELILKNNE